MGIKRNVSSQRDGRTWLAKYVLTNKSPGYKLIWAYWIKVINNSTRIKGTVINGDLGDIYVFGKGNYLKSPLKYFVLETKTKGRKFKSFNDAKKYSKTIIG